MACTHCFSAAPDQSTKSGGVSGFDARKKVKGRKCNPIADPMAMSSKSRAPLIQTFLSLGIPLVSHSARWYLKRREPLLKSGCNFRDHRCGDQMRIAQPVNQANRRLDPCDAFIAAPGSDQAFNAAGMSSPAAKRIHIEGVGVQRLEQQHLLPFMIVEHQGYRSAPGRCANRRATKAPAVPGRKFRRRVSWSG